MSSNDFTNVIAIIPARGGSKGIARKNLIALGGKPLLEHSIECARHSSSITRIAVSTDDPETGHCAQRAGAEVIWRPKELCGDTASSESALVHALDFLENNEGYIPDLVVFMQATSPCRNRQDLDCAISHLQSENADSLFSACPVQGFVWRIEDGELLSMSYDYKNRKRRQDSPEEFIENGSFYIFKPWVLRQLDNRLGGKISMYKMSILDSLQLDEPEDISMIEKMLSLHQMPK